MSPSPALYSRKSLVLPSWATNPRYWLWPIGAILVVIHLMTVHIDHNDSLSYISIARHLFHGQLARLDSSFLHYAPGYPFILAPLFIFGDLPFLAINLFHAGLSLLLMWGVYRWSHRLLGEAAVLVTAFVMVNYSLWYYGRYTLSELPMMVWMVWAVEAMYAVQTNSGKRQIWMILLAILATAMAALTRQTAVFILAGLGVQMLVLAGTKKVSWKKAIGLTLAIGIPVCLILLAWMLYTRHTAASTGSQSYDTFFDLSPWRIRENVRLRISEVGRILVPGMYNHRGASFEWFNTTMMIHLGSALFVFIGWVKLVRRTYDPLTIALFFYTLMYFFWPFDQGTRYMFPMLPVLAVACWILLEWVSSYRHIIWIILIACHLGFSCYFSLKDRQKRLQYPVYWPALNVLATTMNQQITALTPASQPIQIHNFSEGTIASILTNDQITRMFTLVADRNIWTADPASLASGNPKATQAWLVPAQLDHINWVLANASDTPPSGYHLVQTEGKFALWQADHIEVTPTHTGQVKLSGKHPH